MTNFGSALEARGFGKKIGNMELSRALRIAIADEYEAVNIYTEISESLEDIEMKRIINHIVSEEKKHAGQFWELLTKVDPEEALKWREGKEENQEISREERAKGSFTDRPRQEA